MHSACVWTGPSPAAIRPPRRGDAAATSARPSLARRRSVTLRLVQIPLLLLLLLLRALTTCVATIESTCFARARRGPVSATQAETDTRTLSFSRAYLESTRPACLRRARMPPASATSKVPSIAIVGGGIAGLVLALHLLRLAREAATDEPRYTVTIYESADAFGEIGAGVAFGPNASKAMQLIGPEVYAAFEKTETSNQSPSKRDVWFDFRFGESVDGRYKVEGEEGTGPEDRTGELIATVSCAGGQRGVKRSDFLDELIKHVPEGVARFGKRATHYTADASSGLVTLHFRDGTTATHDAVVGCDGIKSSIRKTLLATTPRPEAANAVFSGKYVYRGLIPMDEAVAALGEETAQNSQMYLGRHGHILTFAIDKGRTMNGKTSGPSLLDPGASEFAH